MAYQQYPPQGGPPGYPPQQQGYPPQQPGYPPQQPGYPPQQPGYPPQQPGYPPQQPGYPPQQPQPGYAAAPPQPGYAAAPPQMGYPQPGVAYAQPGVMMQPQVVMQPVVMQPPVVTTVVHGGHGHGGNGRPKTQVGGGRGGNTVVAQGAGAIRGLHHGARVHFENQKHGKCLRCSGQGELSSNGGHGRQATWTVTQEGAFYKISCGGWFLNFKHGQAGTSRAGGRFCLLLIKQQADGDVLIRSADDSQGLAFPQAHSPKPANAVGAGRPAQWDIRPFTGF